MAEPHAPGPGLSTADAAFSELTKEIARQNEDAHKAASKKRAVRDKERAAMKRAWERL
ncbi:MAG TPA: hypothetical protein VGH24_04985 [Solirubrobacteraceae bacterium]|jgi:hypothetical protein